MKARLAVHAALVLGCLLFSFPFMWLLSTSFKYDEEIFVYPPKWVPSVPPARSYSPYVHRDEQLPAELSQRWAQVQAHLEPALWERGRTLIGAERMEGLDEAQVRPLLTETLFAAAGRRVARQDWQQEGEAFDKALLARLEGSIAIAAWEAIFRGVALRLPSVRDTDLEDRPVGEEALLGAWQPVSGQLRCRPLPAERSLRLEYDLADGAPVALEAVFPLLIPEKRFLSLTLPMRQDRSWHRLEVQLEMGGRRYALRDELYLGQRRWQELTFKLEEKDPRDEREFGVWPLVPAVDQAGAFDQPGQLRLRLSIQQAGPLEALWRKYTSSYRQAYLATRHRWNYVFNSAYLVALSIAGQLLSCSLVAYAFARLHWPGREALFGLLLATMMLPGQVTMIPVFLIFKQLGWYNTLKTLWVPSFFGSAFFIFMLRQFMRAIPNDLEDAARIDGCGPFGIYWRIILPLIKPALAAVAIFTFMGTWNDFMGPLIYLNDQRLYPLALGLFDFRSQHGGEFGMLMAASTLMTLPVIAVFFLAQKYFIQGVTLTGMKG